MKNRIQSRHDRRPDESFTGHPVNIVAGAFVGSRSGLENVRTDAVLIRGSSVGRVDLTCQKRQPTSGYSEGTLKENWRTNETLIQQGRTEPGMITRDLLSLVTLYDSTVTAVAGCIGGLISPPSRSAQVVDGRGYAACRSAGAVVGQFAPIGVEGHAFVCEQQRTLSGDSWTEQPVREIQCTWSRHQARHGCNSIGPVWASSWNTSKHLNGRAVTAGETARNSESALFRACGELTHGRNVREGTARNLATRNSVNADTIGQRCVTAGRDRPQFSSAWRSRQTQVISLLETAGDAAEAMKSEDSFAIAAAVDGTPFTKAAGANPAALAFFPPNPRVNDPVGEAGRSGDSQGKVNPGRSGMRRRTVMPKL